MRKGSSWQAQPWDPSTAGEETPSKKARREAGDRESERTEVSLKDIFCMDKCKLAHNLADKDYLERPQPCTACKADATAHMENNKMVWMCRSSCKEIRCSVYANNPYSKQRIHLDIHEYGAIHWCWSHNFTSEDATLLTGIALSTVKDWYSLIREQVKKREKQHQEKIVFSSKDLVCGVCELEGDASRMKKKHVWDQNGQVTSTWHAPVLGFLQRNSTKFVGVNMEAVEVKAGSDGKPGALPPEKDKVVYDLAKKVIGRGVLLNSDGGSGGDGDLDESSSNSPYAKACLLYTSPSPRDS